MSIIIEQEETPYKTICEESYKYIIHLSDIHIRLIQRHEEYKVVFENLYKSIDSLENIQQTLIVITGDIFHVKGSLTPECIQLSLDFFIRLTKFTKVIVIAGNHDCIQENQDRMDNLTGIFLNQEIPNLYYLKFSGIYRFGNIFFGVSSILDNGFITYSQVDESINAFKEEQQKQLGNDNSTIHSIALFHGPVGMIHTEHLFRIRGEHTVEDFEGYDLTLLGDIHHFQYLNYEKTIAYASSLVSQNFVETDNNHGFLYWDIETKESTYYPIHNPYHHKKIFVNEKTIEYDGEYYPFEPSFQQSTLDSIVLPEKAHVKVIYYGKQHMNTPLIKKWKSNYPNVHWLEMDASISKKQEEADSYESMNNSLLKMNIEMSEAVQDYLSQKDSTDVTPEIMEFLVKELNSNINSSENRNYSWEILELHFSYFFGYGKDNVIDFTSLNKNDIFLILGKNSVGKSSLIDILCFILFSKLARRYNNSKTNQPDIINIRQKHAFGELFLRIGAKIYVIQKKCTKKKEDSISVDTQFFELKEIDQSMQSLTSFPQKDLIKYKDNIYLKVCMNSLDHTKTEKYIMDFIGSDKAFMFCNVFLQFDSESFLLMKQTDRKKFIYEFLELDTFTTRYEEYNKKYRLYNQELERITEYLNQTNPLTMEDEIQAAKKSILTYSQYQDTLEIQRNQKKELLEEYQKKYTIIDYKPDRLPFLQKEKKKIEFDIEKKQSNIKDTIKKIDLNESQKKLLKLINDESMIKEEYFKEVERIENDYFEKQKTLHERLASLKSKLAPSSPSINESTLTQIERNIELLERKKTTSEQKCNQFIEKYNKQNEQNEQNEQNTENIQQDNKQDTENNQKNTEEHIMLNYNEHYQKYISEKSIMEYEKTTLESEGITSGLSAQEKKQLETEEKELKLILSELKQRSEKMTVLKNNLDECLSTRELLINVTQTFNEYEQYKITLDKIESEIGFYEKLIFQAEQQFLCETCQNNLCTRCKSKSQMEDLRKNKLELNKLFDQKNTLIETFEETHKSYDSCFDSIKSEKNKYDENEKKIVQIQKELHHHQPVIEQKERRQKQIETTSTKADKQKKYSTILADLQTIDSNWFSNPVQTKYEEYKSDKTVYEQEQPNLQKIIQQLNDFNQKKELTQKQLEAVKANKEVQKEIDECLNDEKSLILSKKNAIQNTDSSNPIITAYSELEKESKLLQEYEKRTNILTIEKKDFEKDLIVLQDKKHQFEMKIDEEEKKAESMEKNKEYETMIQNLKLEIFNTEKQKENLYKDIYEQNRIQEMNERLLTEYAEKKNLCETTRQEMLKYKHLSSITSKDGFALYLLEEYLQHITKSVNQIISPFLNKKVQMYLKNDDIIIDFVIQDVPDSGTPQSETEYSKQFKVCTLGGMERLIIDCSFKIVFSHCSTVNSTSLLLIDESVSVLDKDNLGKIYILLEYLKQYFEHTFIITHIQELKEHVENKIEITSENEYSKIFLKYS